MPRPAVFLDRDQTLIAETGYLCDPARLRLLPGVPEGLRTLQAAGYELVVVTNQGGIARGVLTEGGLAAIHAELRAQLAREGVHLDAIYYCPYHPEGTVAPYNREHADRKPGAGMLLRAARELGLDMSRSWMVGDARRDVLAGQSAGLRTILLGEAECDGQQPDYRVADLPAAAAIIVGTDAGRGR